MFRKLKRYCTEFWTEPHSTTIKPFAFPYGLGLRGGINIISPALPQGSHNVGVNREWPCQKFPDATTPKEDRKTAIVTAQLEGSHIRVIPCCSCYYTLLAGRGIYIEASGVEPYVLYFLRYLKDFGEPNPEN